MSIEFHFQRLYPSSPFRQILCSEVRISRPQALRNWFVMKLSLLIDPVKLQRSSIGAVVGDKTEAPNSFTNEQVSSSELSTSPYTQEEGSGCGEGDGGEEAEFLEGNKMVRVCVKLIDVFLVDKPNPTDWRRLLAFSKEWDNIRPHFFKRCNDRADSDDDPEKKSKLLHLGRKLKEVDEDVRRHNELLKVVKGTPPSEIGEIVARRRKDFTK